MQIRKSIFALHILFALPVLTLLTHGQSLRLFLPERVGEWQRVVTASDSNIDVNTSSLILEPDGIFRATFRTSLSKSEEAFEKPGVKYKTRFETIQFDSRERRYRSLETTLLDSSEKVVLESGLRPDAKWRLAGPTAARLYAAAMRLGPFSTWRITSVRFADGRKVTADEDAQLAQLLGAYVRVELGQFRIARTECLAPSYESASISDREYLKWTGKSLKDVGLGSDKIDTLKITCRQGNSTAELSYLFVGPNGRATLLSGGVLIDLEKL